MSTEVSFEDEEAFIAAIADVRSDASDVAYMFCEHKDGNPNVLRVLCTGTDTSEIGSKMDSAQHLYGLARYGIKFDMTSNVRFVFITWCGESTPFAKRGRYGVVKGSIDGRFSPYHIEVSTSSSEDLEPEKIIQVLNETAFTKSKVLDSESEVSARQMRGFTQTQLPQRDAKANFFAVSAVSSKGAGVEIGENVYEAVNRVRNDVDSATWMVAGYEGSNPKGPVSCMAVGEGGLSDLMDKLDDSLPMYGLYRHEHTDSESITTTKFVYIIWVGQQVKPMTRAKISTQKGTFEEIFCPAHVTVFASELSEIDEKSIMDKIKMQGSC